MFDVQAVAPVSRVLELVPDWLQVSYGLRVGHGGVLTIEFEEGFEVISHARLGGCLLVRGLLNITRVGIKDLEIRSTCRQHMRNNRMEQACCDRVELRQRPNEGRLGLQHPKFSQMANRLRVFSPKCRSKCIDPRQCRGSNLCLL